MQKGDKREVIRKILLPEDKRMGSKAPSPRMQKSSGGGGGGLAAVPWLLKQKFIHEGSDPGPVFCSKEDIQDIVTGLASPNGLTQLGCLQPDL